MASLAYPQLSSGAEAQYPLRRRRLIQSPANTFADGSIVTVNFDTKLQMAWDLAYTDLSIVEQSALQNLFTACHGALLPFTFIDPTDNMLSQSTNLAGGAWQADPLLSVTPGASDPLGGSNAFTLLNAGQIDQELRQQISAPSNFQYCFSIFAFALAPTSVSVGVEAVSSQTQQFKIGPNWTRLVSAPRLNDEQMTFKVALIVPAGQTLVLFGPQLEPQLAPSRYRPTVASGGVYPNAHFLGDSLTFESTAPGLFSTVISIETT